APHVLTIIELVWVPISSTLFLFNEKLRLEVHVNDVFWMFVEVNWNSNPLFSTFPMFFRMEENPDSLVVGTLSSKSVVLLRYASAVNCKRSANRKRSRPMLVDVVFSQLRSSLGMVEGTRPLKTSPLRL